MVLLLFVQIVQSINILSNISLNTPITINMTPYEPNFIQYTLNLTNITDDYVGLELYSQQPNYASAKVYAEIDGQLVEQYFQQSSPNVIQCLLRTGNQLLGRVININISLTFIPQTQTSTGQQFTFSAMKIQYINYGQNQSLQLQSQTQDAIYYTNSQNGIPYCFCIQVPVAHNSEISTNVKIFYSYTSLTAPEHDSNTFNNITVIQTSLYSYGCIDIKTVDQKISETLLFRIRFNGRTMINSTVFLTFNSSFINNFDILRPNMRKEIKIQNNSSPAYQATMIPLFYGQLHRKYSNISYAISMECTAKVNVTITDNTSLGNQQPIINQFTCTNNVTHLFKLNLIDAIYLSISGTSGTTIKFLYTGFANFFILDLEMYLDTVLNTQMNTRMYLQSGFEQQIKLFLINNSITNDISLYVSKDLIQLPDDKDVQKYYQHNYTIESLNEQAQPQEYNYQNQGQNNNSRQAESIENLTYQPFNNDNNSQDTKPIAKTIEDSLKNPLEKGWVYISVALLQDRAKSINYGYFNLKFIQMQFNLLQKPGVNAQYQSFMGQNEINLKYTAPKMVSSKMLFTLNLAEIVNSAVVCIDHMIGNLQYANTLSGCYTYNLTKNVSVMISQNQSVQKNTQDYRPRIFIYLNAQSEQVVTNFGICQYYNLQEHSNGINVVLNEDMEFMCLQMRYVRLLCVQPSTQRLILQVKIQTNQYTGQYYYTLNSTYCSSFNFTQEYLLFIQFFNTTNTTGIQELDRTVPDFFSAVSILNRGIQAFAGSNNTTSLHSVFIYFNSQIPYQLIQIGVPLFISISVNNTQTNQYAINKFKHLQYIVIEAMFTNVDTSYSAQIQLQNCTFVVNCPFQETYQLNNNTNILVINTANYNLDNIYITFSQNLQQNISNTLRIRVLDSNPTLRISQSQFFIRYYRQSKQCQLLFEIDHLIDNLYNIVSVEENDIYIQNQTLNLTYSLYYIRKGMSQNQTLSFVQIQALGTLVHTFMRQTQTSQRTYDNEIFSYTDFQPEIRTYVLLLNASNGNEYVFRQMEVVYEQISTREIVTITLGVLNIILLGILIFLGILCRQKNRQFQEQNDQKIKLQKQ